MFDTYHRIDQVGSVSVSVTEKRAPTDESVRLLREMEIAAAAKVESAIRVQDTSFECVVHTQQDHLNGRTLLAATFSLNGKRIVAQTSINEGGKDDPIAKLVEAVAERIAFEILSPCFTGALLKSANWRPR